MNAEKCSEEFNNFMHRATEVSNIVQKLASTDKSLQEIGSLEAARYLGEDTVLENINEEDVVLKIKNNRTVINQNAIKMETMDQETMSQEAFMKEVERDSEKRYQEKLVRKEKMQTLRKQGASAFKKQEYEKALSYFNKAIEHIKDNFNLYLDRALTYLQLCFYDKALNDIETALKLNENSLKAHLLFCKCLFYNKQFKELKEKQQETLEKFPDKKQFCLDYFEEIKTQK